MVPFILFPSIAFSFNTTTLSFPSSYLFTHNKDLPSLSKFALTPPPSVKELLLGWRRRRRKRTQKGRKEKQEWSEELTKSTKCKRKERRQGRATKAKSGALISCRQIGKRRQSVERGSTKNNTKVSFVDPHFVLHSRTPFLSFLLPCLLTKRLSSSKHYDAFNQWLHHTKMFLYTVLIKEGKESSPPVFSSDPELVDKALKDAWEPIFGSVRESNSKALDDLLDNYPNPPVLKKEHPPLFFFL